MRFGPAPPPVPTNGLGIASFVLSLTGFCIPVLPSLAALVCGIVAVRREPRGLAIAGIVISLVSGCMSGAVVMALLLPALAISSGAMQTARDQARMYQLAVAVDAFRTEYGRLPQDFAEASMQGSAVDAQGNAFRLDLGGAARMVANGYRIVGAGPDGQFDTPDDVVVLGMPPSRATDGAVDETEPVEDGAGTPQPGGRE